MLAVLKREFRAYFQTVIGWLAIAVILALYGLYFYVYNLTGGYPYISYSLSAISFILLIAIPLLTMRSLSEERKNKTDQLILTAPVSVGKIVLGKYLAIVGVFTIDMIIIGLTPLILSMFGTVPMGESYTAIFGFWLYGCACIAIGMFISSITESQVIAAVLSFGALFLGYMMAGILSLFTEENILTTILGCYDLYTPLNTFFGGCLDLTGVTYFVSISALFLFFTVQSIQKRRWSISSNKISLGVFNSGLVVVTTICVIIVNLVVVELPATWTSIDATSTQMYSITDDTKNYLKGLEEDITIYVLADEDSADTTLAETLERYEGLSGHVKVEYKSTGKYPTFYKQYTDTTPSSNSLIVASASRSRVIDYDDIYVYSFDYSSYSYTIDGYDAEGQITSAIQYVTMDTSELPVVYEITGHGETALAGGFTEAIEKANITLESLTLLEQESVPEDAKAIIINAPTSDFSSDDTQKVLSYLEAGGKAIIIGNFQYPDLENFNSILGAYGVEAIEGMVMDNDYSYSYQSIPYYLLPEVESSSYTSSVTNAYIFAPYSIAYVHGVLSEEEISNKAGESTETVSIVENESENAQTTESTEETESTITYTDLLVTSEDSISKVNLENFTTYEYEEGDIKGPFAVGLAIEKEVDEENTTKIVAIGSLMLFTDSADEVVSGNNAAMFEDVVSELIGDVDLSTSVIAAKDYTLSAITVSSIGTIISAIGIIIIVPILLIAVGVVIWVRRRKK